MKKIFLTFGSIVICAYLLIAQAHELQWVTSIGAIDTIDGKIICTDTLGNIYHAGNFAGSADFDPGPNTFTMNSSGDIDGHLMKLSPDGDFIWAKSYGSTGVDKINDIHIDSNGNLYAVGYFEGTVNFGGGSLGQNTLTSIGLLDCFLLKADSDGNTIWVKQFGSVNNENLFQVTTDNSNNIYAVGSYSVPFDVDPGFGQTFLTAGNGVDSWLVKLDPNGNFDWAKAIASGPASQWAQQIVIDFEQNIYTSGIFNDLTDLDPNILVDEHSSSGSYDAFFQKLGNDGSLIWAESFGGTEYDLAGPIILDNSANIYCIGFFYGTVDFDPGIGVHNVTAVGNRDTYLLKLSSLGEFEWVNTFGSGGYEYHAGLAIDADGYIYSNGLFQDTMDIDPGPAVIPVISNGEGDAYYMKHDQDGNLIWFKQVGGEGHDTSRDVTIDSDGNIIIMGRFGGTTDFDPGPEFSELTAVAGYDIYFSKFTMPIVSIEEIAQEDKSVSVYPNPTSQRVYVVFEEPVNQALCNILDAQGKLIQSKSISNEKKYSIDLDLAAGIYYLEIVTEGSREIIRLVKE